ncbi:MAG: C10 family peptidase [Bacteroidales bacterium]|nr:C10 family peptidase [Bacteroidales bacterium]
MKRHFAIILAISLLFVCCSKENDHTHTTEKKFSRFISISEAQKDVENLISDISATKSIQRREISDSWTTSISTKSGDFIPEAYVFNFKDSLGYAIVSSDTRVGLIGFALEGIFDENSEISNPGLIVTLSNAQSVLARADSLDEPYGYEITYEYGEWENQFSTPIYGYCPVKWAQGSPYNQYCFTSDGQRAKTGCVATAVAQLMSIYQYPTSYSGFSFNWYNMISSPYTLDYYGNYSVGILMQQLGVTSNLDMDYGVLSSGASPENIPRTFVNFGYSNGGALSSYSTYLVASELESGYPVLLSGYDTRHTTIQTNIFGKVVSITYSYEGGHCWLAHGLLTRRRLVSRYEDGVFVGSYYQTNNYILCNFGWGGVDDGYYADWAFDTNAGPIYGETIATRGTTTTTESNPGFYEYHITSVTGIRR